jgi:colanic acid/amylovoran biosynthesis glycosyltransferase
MAYLVSQYPATNHTFILREIRQLRVLGFDISVASIRDCDRKMDQLTSDEKNEAAKTFYVVSSSKLRILSAHLATMIRHPLRYFGGLLYALSLNGFDLPQTWRTLLYFVEAVVVGRWMESEGLPHLHTHFSSTVALLVHSVFSIPISITLHGPAEFEDPRLFHLREKVRKSSFVCTISDFASSRVMMASSFSDWKKIRRSYLGVDTSVFTPYHERNRSQVFQVIFVGRLSAVKAQHILIAAVAELRKRGRQLHVHLVGDGPERKSLEAHAKSEGLEDCIFFEGWCNQDRVISLYKGADLFVLPSFDEGVPVVLMEAMAMEIPCIATRIAGIPELIRDEKDGILVAPSNVPEMVDAISRLMDNPDLRRQLGRSGRQRIIEKFELEKNVLCLSRIFEEEITKRDD